MIKLYYHGKQTKPLEELKNVYESEHIFYEDCSDFDEFKLFIEFTVPFTNYQETCMSFIRFFSGATRIPHEPIFIIKSTNENYFVTAIYPCVVKRATLWNIRFQAIQSDEYHKYNIGCPIHYLTYKPLPRSKGKCWLLDANGKEYRGNNIRKITADNYFRQIVVGFQMLPDVGPGDSCAKIMEKQFPHPEFQHLELPDEQRKWFAKQMNEANKPGILSMVNSLSFQYQANTCLDIIGLETPLPRPEIPRTSFTSDSLRLLGKNIDKSKKPKKSKEPIRSCQISTTDPRLLSWYRQKRILLL